MARTSFDLDYLVLGVKADYYFDKLFELPPEWDVYGGINGGYKIWLGDNDNNDSDFDLGVEVGGRWFWNDKWGVVLEVSGGVGYGGMLGVTMKL